MGTTVYALLVPGFADWELAFALPEIKKRQPVVTVGLALEPVSSMGGVRALPELRLADADADEAAMLLVPGSKRWERTVEPELTSLLCAWHARGVVIGGICGGTIALAAAGLLDERRHTSNLPGYLERFVPRYRGRAHYLSDLAVRDDRVITASGAGPVEFAREILAALGIYGADDLATWFALFKHGMVPA